MTNSLGPEFFDLEQVTLRTAIRETDHAELVSLARKSPYTSAFSSIMFSGAAAYKKGWIRLAEMENEGVVAMSCVRHKVREPKTSLYFLIVHPMMRGLHLGSLMLHDVEEQSPHQCVQLNVNKNNSGARIFYEYHDYVVTNERAMNGAGWGMEKSW